ncbi:MAG: hypothetical protein GY698_10545 [Actinomycetia bacterium]|nr:hypothetical protein [Actinomycetes bacterium]
MRDHCYPPAGGEVLESVIGVSRRRRPNWRPAQQAQLGQQDASQQPGNRFVRTRACVRPAHNLFVVAGWYGVESGG